MKLQPRAIFLEKYLGLEEWAVFFLRNSSLHPHFTTKLFSKWLGKPYITAAYYPLRWSNAATLARANNKSVFDNFSEGQKPDIYIKQARDFSWMKNWLPKPNLAGGLLVVLIYRSPFPFSLLRKGKDSFSVCISLALNFNWWVWLKIF